MNLDHVFSDCLSLIEWPVRLPDNLLPVKRLDINITISNDSEEAVLDSSEDEDADENIDSKARIMTLSAKSPIWNEQLEKIRNGGMVDDLITE